MINNFNFLVLKIYLFKKNKCNFLLNFKHNKTKTITSFDKKVFNYNYFLYFILKNSNFLSKNNLIFFNLFNFFFFYIFGLKIKTIFYFNLYLSYFYKNNFLYHNSFYNYHYNNTLNFYKFFNKVYLTYKWQKKKKLKVSLFEKNDSEDENDEVIDPFMFMNFTNFHNKIKFLKKTKVNSYNLISFTFDNLNFVKFKVKSEPVNKYLLNYNYFYSKIGSICSVDNCFSLKYLKKNKKNKKKFNKQTLFIENNFDFLFQYVNFYKSNRRVYFKKPFDSFWLFRVFKKYYFNTSIIDFRFNYKKHFKYKLKFNYYNNKKFVFKNSRRLNFFIKNLIFLDEFYPNNFFFKKRDVLLYSNNFFFRNLGLLGNSFIPHSFLKNDSKKLNKNFICYNNYYPVVYAPTKSQNIFFSQFKINTNMNFSIYLNYYIISFLENFLNKKFYLKVSNNNFKKTDNLIFLHGMYNNYKNYQPKYMKKFLIKDFIEILWYSFFLKDLTMISDWIKKFMELSSFRVHKRFISFFQNFIHKNRGIFMNNLKIKGFFFDIRGKVGVTGNSKKRHFFFKIGKLSKSTKKIKIDFKQSIVRTPSGAMGLTYIISY